MADRILIDPVATVTLSADVSNVGVVLIDGRIQERDGRLVADVSRAVDLVNESRDYLVGQIENPKPDWLAV